MADEYDPTPDDEPDEDEIPEETAEPDEPRYIIDPENDAWLWAIPGAAVLSFVVVFALRLNWLPRLTDNFTYVVVVEALVLLVLLVIGVLTTVERDRSTD